jgi:hypothetical protein
MKTFSLDFEAQYDRKRGGREEEGERERERERGREIERSYFVVE